MGRRGRHSAPQTLRLLAEEAGASRRWSALGWWGLAATLPGAVFLQRHRRLGPRLPGEDRDRNVHRHDRGSDRGRLRRLPPPPGPARRLARGVHGRHSLDRVARHPIWHREGGQPDDARALPAAAGDGRLRDARRRLRWRLEVSLRSRLLQALRRGRPGRDRSGLFLGQCRHRHHSHLRRVPAQRGQPHPLGPGHRCGRHPGRVARRPGDLPDRVRPGPRSGERPRADLRHLVDGLRTDAGRRDRRFGVLPAGRRRRPDLVDLDARGDGVTGRGEAGIHPSHGRQRSWEPPPSCSGWRPCSRSTSGRTSVP